MSERILHAYADTGTESEVLAGYGDVVRVGLDPRDTNASHPVAADATRLPFSEGATFRLGLWQPPCTRYSELTSISGDPEDHPNLIPEARAGAKRYCEHWIIENKPAAPLRDPVVLNARMFGLPINYERAFETSFHVEQPARLGTLTPDAEVSPYFSADRSREWWGTVKGYDPSKYVKQHLAKNCIPRVFLDYLLLAWLRASDETDRRPARATHDA